VAAGSATVVCSPTAGEDSVWHVARSKPARRGSEVDERGRALDGRPRAKTAALERGDPRRTPLWNSGQGGAGAPGAAVTGGRRCGIPARVVPALPARRSQEDAAVEFRPGWCLALPARRCQEVGDCAAGRAATKVNASHRRAGAGQALDDCR
jgi:hypothetical protein